MAQGFRSKGHSLIHLSLNFCKPDSDPHPESGALPEVNKQIHLLISAALLELGHQRLVGTAEVESEVEETISISTEAPARVKRGMVMIQIKDEKEILARPPRNFGS